MYKYLIAAITIIVSCNVAAQEVCTPEEKGFYYKVTETTRTVLNSDLRAGMTPHEIAIWNNTVRTNSWSSETHKDLTACNEALDFLKAQTGIPGVPGKIPAQLVKYEGSCLTVEVCP